MMNKNVVDLIYNFYKNDIISDCKKFKSELMDKYKLDLKTAGDIYVRIVNYQIKKYGTQIGLDKGEFYESKAEHKRKVENAKHRKRSRRRTY